MDECRHSSIHEQSAYSQCGKYEAPVGTYSSQTGNETCGCVHIPCALDLNEKVAVRVTNFVSFVGKSLSLFI